MPTYLCGRARNGLGAATNGPGDARLGLDCNRSRSAPGAVANVPEDAWNWSQEQVWWESG